MLQEAATAVEPADPPANPDFCRVNGLAEEHTVNAPAEFQIEAHTSNDVQKEEGGDAFFVAVRGASRVRARITDNKDGTYNVAWKPVVSGHYTVAVSLFGYSIAGSPFSVTVFDPAPFAPKCEVKGKALNHITARTSSSFEICYRDRSGNAAQAVELDVFVAAIDEASSGPAMATWQLGTMLNAADAPAVVTDSPHPTGSSATRKSSRKSKVEAASGPPPPVVVAEDGGDYASADEGDGLIAPADDAVGDPHAAASDQFSSSAQAPVTIKRRAITVQVADKPLIVRARAALDSQEIGVLFPGQTVTVVEERIAGVRRRHSRRCRHGHTHALRGWRHPLPATPRVRAVCAPDGRPHGSSAQANVRACITFDDSPLARDSLPTSVISSARGLPGSARSVPGADRDLANSPAALAVAELMKRNAAADGASAAPAEAAAPSRQPLQGWVTLKKAGRKLVTSRLRLEPVDRQQHMQQWKRRQLNDKLKRGVDTVAGVVDGTR